VLEVTGSTTAPARAEKGPGLAQAVRAELALDHHRELDSVGDADPADLGVVDPFDEGLRLRLAVEDRDQSGRIDDHFGRPRSSYSSSAWSG